MEPLSPFVVREEESIENGYIRTWQQSEEDWDQQGGFATLNTMYYPRQLAYSLRTIRMDLLTLRLSRVVDSKTESPSDPLDATN